MGPSKVGGGLVKVSCISTICFWSASNLSPKVLSNRRSGSQTLRWSVRAENERRIVFTSPRVSLGSGIHVPRLNVFFTVVDGILQTIMHVQSVAPTSRCGHAFLLRSIRARCALDVTMCVTSCSKTLKGFPTGVSRRILKGVLKLSFPTPRPADNVLGAG